MLDAVVLRTIVAAAATPVRTEKTSSVEKTAFMVFSFGGVAQPQKFSRARKISL
jgi:hypothetical protein